jgi:thymidylate kinase
MNPRESFLVRVFRILEERGIEYCVARNFDRVFPEGRSDVDLIARKRDIDALCAACEAAAAETGFTLVQEARFVNHAWVFADGRGTLVQIDVDTSVRWRQYPVLTAEEVLRARRRGERFYFAAPEHEAAILRTQIAWQGGVSERYAKRLAELGASAENVRRSIMLGSLSRQFEEIAAKGEDIARLFDRVFGAFFANSTGARGACVVLAGLDGAGKTTFARELLVEAVRSRRFSGVRYFHWIPSPLRRQEFPWPAETERPRLAPTKPGLLSALRLARNIVRAWIGFALVVRPLVRRGWLVIIDRYVLNYWLDPGSVRYAGPDWWLDWAEPFFPKTDTLIVLDADAATLRSRKGELSDEQIVEQRARLRSRPSLADSRIDLDAAQPTAALVAEALPRL